MQVISNLLYFYGMSNFVKEYLLRRYFSQVLGAPVLGINSICIGSYFIIWLVSLLSPELWQEVRGDADVQESDIVQACRKVSASAKVECVFFSSKTVKLV